MKHIRILLTLLIALLLIIGTASATDLFNATTFKGGVANGIMTGTGSTSTTGWVGDEKYSWYATRVATTGSVNFNTTSAANDTQSLDIVVTDATGRFTITNTDGVSLSSLSKYAIPISPNTDMNVYAFIKTSNAQGTGAYISTTQYDSAGVAGTTSTSSKLTGTNDYTKIGYAVTTDADAAYMVVTLDHAAGAAQVINFDDVTVETTIADTATTGGRVYPVAQGVTSTDNIDQMWWTPFTFTSFDNKPWQAQQFQPTKSQLTGVALNLSRGGTNPIGTLVVAIETDDGSNKPSGIVLSSTSIDATTLPLNVGSNQINFTTPAILNPANKYWVTLKGNSSWVTDYPTLSYTPLGTYPVYRAWSTNGATWTDFTNQYNDHLITFYAKNTEDVNWTINGVSGGLISNGTIIGDATGLLPGAIVNTANGTYIWNPAPLTTASNVTSWVSSIYAVDYAGNSGTVIANGWRWLSNAYVNGATANAATFIKVNTMLPVTSVSLTMQEDGASSDYQTNAYISGDNSTWVLVLPAKTDNQPHVISGTTHAVDGNSTFYIRLKPNTGKYSYLGNATYPPLTIGATLNTTTSNATVLTYVTGNNYVNVSSNGRAASSSLDPSLMADVWLVKVAAAYSITANFTISNSTGFEPLLTHFTDTSTTSSATIDAWNWSFGDGEVSATQSPDHTFANNGTYSVNLTITNTSYSLVSTQLSNITVYNRPPIADFTASNLSGTPPLLVQFTDTSTGVITNRYWDFGEGNTSALQNPEHTFENIGEYQVNLTVTNDGGSSTKLQNITVALFGAHFIANKTSGVAPLPILFTDTSIGSYDTWNWSVDDGTLHWYNKTVYADRNLEYTFNNVGSWRVNLSVQNISELGAIYSTSMNITATNVPPVASFTGYPSAGTTSTTFIFNSTSTGIITTYNWSFGDGNYSATQNTTHVFPSNGIYNVNLTVSNDGGSSYIVHPFTVSAFSVSTSISPTSGVIPLLVTFNETYSGLIPDSYYWEFGDGATSTDKNTTHTYTTIGIFDVNHRIMNGSIISWANTTSAVTTLGGSVAANFTADVTTGDYPLDVQFTDTSTYINATPSSWYWTFGDGLTSTSQNPSHTYSNAGTYSVNFTTTTDYGESSKLRSAYINVGGVAANGRQDIILTNTNNIVTLYVKDATSGNLITHAAVSDEMGNELTSYGNGIFSGSYSTGQHTFTANATDYYNNRATYLISGDLIQTIYLTQVASSVSTTWYTPKTIVISFVDAYGNQVRGASVNARFNETTLPNGVSDLISNYGMNVNVANEALNGTLLMSGSTDYQGSIVFTMLSALKYDIAITYNGETNYYSMYPQDSQYQFRFLTTVATDNIWDDLYANGNTKVWATEPDPSNVTFWWSFQDMTSLTTRVDFYLKDVDLDTMVYITNVTPPIAGNIYQLNYTVPNVRGKNYLAWGNYTRDV